MSYVADFVQSGVSLAERHQVGKYVDKAREFESIDTVLDLVSKHGPQAVEFLDKKVELALGGVSDCKTTVLEQVEKVQQKKNDAVEYVQQKKDDAVEYAQQKKDGAVEFAQQKKDGAFEFAQQKKESVLEYVEYAQQKKGGAFEFAQQKKDGAFAFAQQKKVKALALSKQLQQRAVGTPAEKVAVYVALMADAVVAQAESVARRSLTLPMTLQEMAEARKQEAAAAAERAQQRLHALKQTLAEKRAALVVVLADKQRVLVRVASREFVLSRAETVKADVAQLARTLADPRALVESLKQRGAEGLAPLSEAVCTRSASARAAAESAARALQARCASAGQAMAGAYAHPRDAAAVVLAKAAAFRAVAAAVAAQVVERAVALKPHRD